MTWFDSMFGATLRRRFPSQQEDVPEIETWARLVTRETPLPEVFERALIRLGHHDRDASYVIFQPADQWGSRCTAPRLVAWDGAHLDIIIQRDTALDTQRFPVDSIETIQRGRILLYSWLKLDATVGGRQITRIVEFNTVVESVFNKLIDSVRKARAGIEHASDYQVEPARTLLSSANQQARRLLAYARGSLLRGEQVISVHTCVEEGRPLRYGGRFRKRTYIPGPYVIVLTSHEVIEIHEDWRLPTQQKRYGAIWEFAPLS